MPNTSTNVIPAEQFFIPLNNYDAEQFQIPALVAGAYEVHAKPIYHEDKSDDCMMRGAVRQLPESVGRVLTRTDNDAPLGVVGAQYAYQQNQDVYAAAWDALTKCLPEHVLHDCEMTEAVERDGAFYRVDLTFPSYGGEVRQADGSKAKLVLHGIVINVHGQNSPRIIIAAKDMTCDNINPLDEITAPASRRTSNYDLQGLTANAVADIQEFSNHIQQFRDWTQKKLDADQFHHLLQRNSFSPSQTNRLVDYFVEDSKVRGENVWCAYSTLTAFATHNDFISVRNSANVNNEMESLTKRMYHVSKVVASRAFSEVLA